MQHPKLMIISRGLAPMVVGGTILLNNLMEEYPGELVAAAGPCNRDISDPGFKTPCRTYYHQPVSYKWFEVYYDKITEKFPWIISRFLDDKIKKEKPDVIMAPVPEVLFFVEAFKAAQRHGIPFYAHTHDLWQENYPEGSFKRKLADEWEKEIFTKAARVMCMTDIQQAHYEKKYGIRCDIMPHTVTGKTLADAPSGPKPSDGQTILFTGSVSSHMNMDALKEIGKASKLMKSKHTLLMCTPWKKEDLQQAGVDSPYLESKYVSRAEVQQIQAKAAVLLAPLSLKNGAMDEVRTVYSTKLLEYIVAGRPILIFAPKDSFHAIDARRRGWAYVVDEDDPKALAEGIDKLMTDEVLCETIIKGALAEAHRRHAKPFAAQLYEWVKTDA